MLSLVVGSYLTAQSRTDYYQGGHYGAHKPWLYISKITTQKKGDTLEFERLVYRDSNELNTGNVLATDRVTMLMFNENSIRILSDSLSFNWPKGPKCYKLWKNDSLVIEYQDPKRINFDFKVGDIRRLKPDALTFSSIAALELYLSQCDLFEGFEKDFLMADDTLRPFRVRVLGIIYFHPEKENSSKCFDISINPLDRKSLHGGKIFMEVASRAVLKREFVTNETKHKSILHEYRISLDL